MSRTNWVGVLLAVALGGQLSSNDATAQTLRTIALTGQPAPGAAVGRTYQLMLDATINDRGEAAILAALNGSSFPYQGQGIWTWQPETGLQAEVVAGNPAPSSGSRTFTSFFSPVLNNNGELAFRATVGDAANATDGIWSDAGGSGLQRVALIGEPAAPAGPGWRFGTLNPISHYDYPAMNDAGRVVFRADLTSSAPGANPTNSVWEWMAADGLELTTRAGDSPAGAAGAQLAIMYGSTINSAGTIGFLSVLDGPGVDHTNQNAIVESTLPGTPAIVVRDGEPAPGAPGAELLLVDNLQLNDQGHRFFRAQLTTVPNATHDGLWSDRNGVIEPLYLYGEHPPGVPANRTYSSFAYNLVANNRDRVAFSAYHINSDGVGGFSERGAIFSEGRTGVLELVAEQGGQAPELAAGRYFRDVGVGTLNDRGQLAFLGYTGGPSPHDPNFFALYVQDVDGQVKLIAAEQSLMDVDDGPGVDLRQIVGLGFDERGGDGNYSSGLNQRGQVVFRAFFADGTSGVFMSNLVAVPEPSSLFLILTLGVVIMRRWR